MQGRQVICGEGCAEVKETLHGKEPLLSGHVGRIPYHKGSAIRNKAAGYRGAFVRFAFLFAM